MERAPHYYNEPGPRSAGRYPSIAPGHEGQYVSRREHQQEIGEPLGWKKTEVTSEKTGRTRQKWERGSFDRPVKIGEVITLLSGAVSKAATKLHTEQALLLVMCRRSDGTEEYAGYIAKIDILIGDLKIVQGEGKTLLDFMQDQDDKYRWGYAIVATGAVQVMVW